MRKYVVYVDGSSSSDDNVFKVYVPACSKNDAINYVSGNGEVVCVKDVTEDFRISLDKVVKALEVAQFGKAEIDYLSRCLFDFRIAE